MASGDNTRVWFPEMLEELPNMWHPGMTWPEVKEICLLMGQRLEDIRKQKGTSTELSTSCKCGGKLSLSNRISIRSLLFSLRKVGVVTEEDFKGLDKDWKSYQRKNKLDGYGEMKP